MEFEVIQDDALAEELLLERESSSPYPPVEQHGPLRFYDKVMRCASRGCGTSTYCRVQGVPYCTTHSLHKLNEILVENGVGK